MAEPPTEPATEPVQPTLPPRDLHRSRRRLRSVAVGTAAAAVLAVLLFVVLRPTATTTTGQSVVIGPGSVAPNFTLPNLLSTAAAPLPSVELYALGKDRHRPVVLNFYASWCIPCREETPLLASTAKSEAAKGSPVQFVGVDVSDVAADALAFTRQAGITYPVGADRVLKVTSVLYGLNSEPNTYFINEEGVVVGHVLGQVTAPELASWLHRLVGSAG